MTDLHQEIMDRAYAKWRDPDGEPIADLTKENWWDLLDDEEKVAVANGNFNYQVCNGGFSQWDDNRYATDEAIELIVETCESLKTYEGQKVINLIEKFVRIREDFAENDEEGDETAWNIYYEGTSELSDQFYDFNKKWLEQVDAKLVENREKGS